MPGIVKVGFTDRKPHERAAELSRHTGVPLPFAVAWARECINARMCEYQVHKALSRHRVSNKREFFRCDVETAKRAINTVANEYLRRRYRKPIKWGNMMKWLYLTAALCGFIAVVTRPSASIWWIMSKGAWLMIAVGHILPHHRYY